VRSYVPPTVCVIDDDESFRLSIQNLLMSLGIPAATFDSAEAFLASSGLPEAACLVLDIRLGGMSGLDLMAQLNTAHRFIPTVVVTAHGDNEVRQQALRMGAIRFLAKPFQPYDLLAVLQVVMRSSS
jgi:FixJ family two-component response regulator